MPVAGDTVSVVAERAVRRAKLTRVAVTCAVCLGLHAITASYVSYLNVDDAAGSMSGLENAVWESAIFLVPLSYEVVGSLAFLLVTRQRRIHAVGAGGVAGGGGGGAGSQH